ncbi:EamA family transporter [Sporosarcina sp. NCCP-2716]|uniref:DMT family transporter n=1 Tax=Sporosarcina sp. NCCP-2716 TaxID=2943679 RepID=UPI00203D43DF|nr:EamA family transporter [Sporosarcina sp. NCCP-2716]GKV68859.1 EamA family transporter [Sporosarcina sp. NCCP-2716]
MKTQSGMRIYAVTIGGAVCWGLIGLFIAPLYDRGFSAWDVVAIRAIISFGLLALFMVVFFRDQLRTRWKDQIFFACAGVFSLALFNYFYFEVFARSSLSLAVTLLYTGPLFVTLLSRVFFKEPLTARKGLALLCAIAGCGLVVGLLPSGAGSVSGVTLALGILSGFCYALYTMFTKPVTQRYSALTITTYTFFYMCLFTVPTSGLFADVGRFQHRDVWVAALLLSLVSTVAAYNLYTSGLAHLEAGKASILSTIEPIVAVLAGVLLLGDRLDIWQSAGIALVLFSAVLVAWQRRKLLPHEQVIQS